MYTDIPMVTKAVHLMTNDTNFRNSIIPWNNDNLMDKEEILLTVADVKFEKKAFVCAHYM